MPYVSQREAAVALGVTQPAISSYIKRGRLTPPAINDRHQVDIELAREQLSKTISPIRGGNMSDPDRLKSRNNAAKTSDYTEKYAIARAQKEAFDARLKQLEYQRKVGDLVKKSDEYQVLFAVMRELRDALFRIPDRVKGVLLAKTNENEIAQLLDDEIRQALETLDRKIKDLEKEL